MSGLCAVNFINTINQNQISVVRYKSGMRMGRRSTFPLGLPSVCWLADFRRRETSGIIWAVRPVGLVSQGK